MPYKTIISLLLLCVSIVDAQTISTIAGNGTKGYSGDGGLATSTALYAPTGVCEDKNGNLYITDNANHAVRKLATTGIITTIAGNGTEGYSGEGGTATAAQLDYPYGICADPYRNIYFSDQQNNVIRRISSTGIITTVVGNGIKGYSGDGGPAIAAGLYNPLGICLDSFGNLYIADAFNQRIRKVDTAGIIITIAGTGSTGACNGGYSGDGGPAVQARLNVPTGIAVDSHDNIYFTEEHNSVVRKIENGTGIIVTIAGNGTKGYSGDGGPAISAQLDSPLGISIGAGGNIYVTDGADFVVRGIDSIGVITTIAGNGIQGNPLNGSSSATQISLGNPSGVCVDRNGSIYFTDAGQDAVRRVVIGGSVQ